MPCRRTLRDYRNAIKPSAGFNSEIVAELIQRAQSLTGYQRYVVLSFDEVKIQENLVFDKYSGNLIGYVDLGDPELNFSSFNDVNDGQLFKLQVTRKDAIGKSAMHLGMLWTTSPLKKGFLALAHIDAELPNFTANIIIFSLFLSKNYFVRYTP